MGLPLDLGFRTRGQLATDVCAGAYAGGIRFDFTCGDEVYGSCTQLREFFERPVYHRLEERVRAHVLICMLACYLTWHLRKAWAPLTLTDQNPPAPSQASARAASTGGMRVRAVGPGPAARLERHHERQPGLGQLAAESVLVPVGAVGGHRPECESRIPGLDRQVRADRQLGAEPRVAQRRASRTGRPGQSRILLAGCHRR
jgi:hypothetical protein